MLCQWLWTKSVETAFDSSHSSLLLGILPCVVSFHREPGLVYQTKCDWGDDMQFPRHAFKGHCIFHLFSLDPCTEESSLSCWKDIEQSVLWRGSEVFVQYQLVSLVSELPWTSYCNNCNSMRDSEPETPSHVTPKFFTHKNCGMFLILSHKVLE